MALFDLPGPVIHAGDSLSDPLDCRGGTILRVSMPQQWTPANLSFQVSTTQDGPFSDLYDVDGSELIVPVRPGTTVMVSRQPPGALMALAWIRFRSGTKAYSVKQQADRSFSITLEGDSPSVPPETGANSPAATTPPQITVAGAVVSSCAVGDVLTVSLGIWSNDPTSFWPSWLSDSAVVGSNMTYTVQASDSGHTLLCSVTATNAAGNGNAQSNSVAVTGS